MKNKKTVFFALAGIWTSLLFLDKLLSLFGVFQARKKNIISRIIFVAIRLFRSLLVVSVVVMNIFMAIALIDDKNSDN